MSSISINNDSESNYIKDNFKYEEKSHFKHSKKHKNKKIILYNNNFDENKNPSNLGATRNCLYINNYPYISIGRYINLPLLTILSMCCIYIYIYYFFFIDSGPILQKIFNYSFLVYILSHFISIFLNPGIPSYEYNKKIKEDLNSRELNDLDCSKCKICNLSYKLIDKIGHCEKCEICYFGYDHHCIWMGHCVGRYNGIFFVIFIMSTFMFIVICIGMILVKLIKIFII